MWHCPPPPTDKQHVCREREKLEETAGGSWVSLVRRRRHRCCLRGKLQRTQGGGLCSLWNGDWPPLGARRQNSVKPGILEEPPSITGWVVAYSQPAQQLEKQQSAQAFQAPEILGFSPRREVPVIPSASCRSPEDKSAVLGRPYRECHEASEQEKPRRCSQSRFHMRVPRRRKLSLVKMSSHVTATNQEAWLTLSALGLTSSTLLGRMPFQS